MQKKQNIFVRSLRELKSTRCLAVTALLIAINITLDLLGLTIKLPPNLRIGFGFLCNASIGMLFGPVVGMMAGVCTDVLGYFAGNLSMGAYFPGYTLTAVVGGLIWGLWLYPRKVTVWRAIGAKACINLFCNIGLNTLWLTVTRRQGDEPAARHARAEESHSSADRDRSDLRRDASCLPHLQCPAGNGFRTGRIRLRR